MEAKKTHREVKNPQINARFLADFMAASGMARSTILRNAKYQPLAPLVQHDEAKPIVSNFIRSVDKHVSTLTDKAQALRDRLADSDFERLKWDYNADYIERFAAISDKIALPKAELLPAGKGLSLSINGVKVPVEVNFRLRRLTATNKVRVGLAALRYAKGAPLKPPLAAWHSSILYGALIEVGSDDNAEPEQKLCVTIDSWAGAAYAAPGDALTRYKNAKAECAGIAERWPNIKPPPGAVL